MNNVEMTIYLINLYFILNQQITNLEKSKNEIYSSIYKLGLEVVCHADSQKLFKNIDYTISKIKELRHHIEYKNKNLAKEDFEYFKKYVDSL